MRLFIAATLAAQQQVKLELAQKFLRRSSEKISLTKVENLHLTFHFLGETQKTDTERLLNALQAFEIPAADSLRSQLTGYGCFKRREGDLVYADLQVTEEVLQLQKSLGETLDNLGFDTDCRRWKAHVTLARRTRLALPWQLLLDELVLLQQDESYAFSDIVLFESEFTRQGMLYTPLFIFNK